MKFQMSPPLSDKVAKKWTVQSFRSSVLHPLHTASQTSDQNEKDTMRDLSQLSLCTTKQNWICKFKPSSQD